MLVSACGQPVRSCHTSWYLRRRSLVAEHRHVPPAICRTHHLCMSSRVSSREDCKKESAQMLRQAEKRQHRGACALRGSKSVWWESGLSVIGNVNVVQRSGKGERGVGPAVASAGKGTPWGSQERRLSAGSSHRCGLSYQAGRRGQHRLAVVSSQRAEKRRRRTPFCGRRAEKRRR